MGSRYCANRQQESDKGLMFTVGKKVEVTFDSEVSKHIWLPAKILEHNGNGFFLVEWQKRNSCGDPCSVQETVDSLHIRPCPPRLKENDFFLLEKVDAIFDFGWKSGVITKVLADSRYIVFFKHEGNQREFSFSELRPHMEWRDGKWFNTSQDAFSIPPGYQNNEGYDRESANVIDMATRLGSSVSTKNASDEEIPTSLIVRETQIDLEIPLSDETLDIDSSLRERVPDPSLDNAGKEELQWDIQSGDSSLTTGTGATESTSEGKPSSVAAIGIAENGLSVNLSCAKILKRKQIDFGDQEERSGACSRKTCERSVDTHAKKTRSSVGSACGDIRSSGSIQSSRSNSEEPMKHNEDSTSFDEAELHIVNVSNQFEVDYRSLKNLQGRLPKPIAEGSITSFSEKINDPLIDVEITTLVVPTLGQDFGINGDCKKKLVNNRQIKPENDLGSDAMSWLGVRRGDLAEGSIKQCKSHNSKKSGMRHINLNLISEAECEEGFLFEGDVVSPNTQKGKAAEVNLERDSEGSPNNPFDIQLLTNSVGDESATTIGSSMSSETRNAEQYGVASGGKTEEFKCLPFVKRSPLWSTVESMEVFQKRPQNPHFRALQQCKESSREGLAIGCMVTFASVVEKTAKLQFEDPQVSSMNDILETLQELESHGFSVKFVRDRISYLRHKREEQEKLHEEMEKLKDEMIACNLEMSKIDEETEEINDQIKELEEKLSEAFSRKEMKDREIGKLQSKVKMYNESIRSLQRGFDGSLF